jgi:hypothetical protein
MAKSTNKSKAGRQQTQPLSSDDMNPAQEFMESLPPDVAEHIREIARTAESEEDFCKQVFIGECPVCGSDNTADCEDTPMDDPAVGRCLACEAMWCLECDEVFRPGQIECGHWDVCEQCDVEGTEEGWCGVLAWKCDAIKTWKQKQGRDEA